MIDCFIAIDSGKGRIQDETPLERNLRELNEEIDELEGLRNGMNFTLCDF